MPSISSAHNVFRAEDAGVSTRPKVRRWSPSDIRCPMTFCQILLLADGVVFAAGSPIELVHGDRLMVSRRIRLVRFSAAADAHGAWPLAIKSPVLPGRQIAEDHQRAHGDSRRPGLASSWSTHGLADADSYCCQSGCHVEAPEPLRASHCGGGGVPAPRVTTRVATQVKVARPGREPGWTGRPS